MKTKILVLCIVLVATAACDDMRVFGFRITKDSGGASAKREGWSIRPKDPELTGRFSLLQSHTGVGSGKDVPVILRIDSVTGETWVLARDFKRWEGVEDDLRRTGKYNPQTKQVECGIKVPDGRDLNELSKEELIRYLSAAIRNGQLRDPKDPLGIRWCLFIL